MTMDASAKYDDFVDFICGDLLGEGAYRRTFVFTPDPTKVIKCCVRNDARHNVAEFLIWEAIKDDKRLRPWFAPIHHISDAGRWIIQTRTSAITTSQLPKRVPFILNDLKPANWGMLDGRPVCHDYGNATYRIDEACGKRMRLAKWFGTTGY